MEEDFLRRLTVPCGARAKTFGSGIIAWDVVKQTQQLLEGIAFGIPTMGP